MHWYDQQVNCLCFGGVSHSYVNSGDDTSSNWGEKGKYPGAVVINLNVSLLKCPRLYLPNLSTACLLIVHY